MKTSDAIKIGLDTADMIVQAYLGDMSDADIMQRPHPQCNHINWQIGHLISSEHEMVSSIASGVMPALPEGFAAKYSRETGGSDDPKAFCTKDELMAAYKSQREAAVAALAKVSDADWTKETGISYAPTVASLFSMVSNHWLMHCGQWVVVRRQLGKPIVI